MKILISLSAVPLSIIRPYMGWWDKTRYADIFNKYGSGTGKDKYRIYIPLSSGRPDTKSMEAPRSIVEYLSALGMSVADYKLGTAFLSDGKRQVRLGKVLKDPLIRKIYDHDPQRAASKANATWVVVSRHPYDIIGMSFDRGWDSCMNAADGSYKEHLKAEVRNGTLVAYLVTETDKNINRPIARISIKVYKNKTSLVLVPSKTYGTSVSQFRPIVQKFCGWANSGSPEGVYNLPKGSYDDLKLPTYYHHHHRLEDLAKLNLAAQLRIASQPTSTPEFLEILGLSPNTEIRRRVAKNPDTPKKALTNLYGDVDPTVLREIAGNYSTPKETLAVLGRFSDTMVRMYAAANPSTPGETLALLAKDPESSVRLSAWSNRSIPIEILVLLARDPDAHTRVIVARNSATPKETLALLIDTDREKIVIREAQENLARR